MAKNKPDLFFNGTKHLLTVVSVQFSSIPWLNGLSDGVGVGVHERWFSRDPLPAFSMWANESRTVLAWAGMSNLWHCPSSISSSDLTHPRRCQEELFWRGCHGVWHIKIMWVSGSWQLPQEVFPMLWAHKTAVLTWHQVIGLVFQVIMIIIIMEISSAPPICTLSL